MTVFTIRRARPEDLEAAVGVWERARWDAKQPRMRARMDYSHTNNLEHFRGVVMRENDVWLAVEGDEVVGLLALGEREVSQLHVEPRRQRRGIGTALLDHAKALSPEGLTIATFQENHQARAFYEHCGFRAVHFGVSPPPESEPDVRYAWGPGGAD